MKLQYCRFKRTSDSEPEDGVAAVYSFGTHNIRWIVDQHGEKHETVYSFDLIDAPLAYIDTEYEY